ncbi:MAG: glycosyltransferase family 2 protein [Chloroflexi bacterium]|nr:glycosyltransferase family 2 protein [Chloroflexota bacterium]
MFESVPKYTIVIPVYNSSSIIGKVVEHTVKFFEQHSWNYEIILINDGSRDQSWSVISEQASRYPYITAINLMRNYGQHTAVYCGFKYSSGDYVITIDDDFQNPPEEIIHLIEKMQTGHDVVFGRFKQKKHSIIRRIGSHVIRFINNNIFNCPPEIIPTNFRLIHRDVVNRILQYRTAYPYITGLVLMFSHNPANAWVEHREREEGKSNYSLIKILSLVSRILFNYSVWPLRVVSTAGFFVSFAGFFGGAILIVNKLFNKAIVEGWTGLMVMLAFLNGVTILMLGMLGEYTVRILQQISVNEIYHVKDIIRYGD